MKHIKNPPCVYPFFSKHIEGLRVNNKMYVEI